MEQIQIANFTTEEFIEFTYVAGLHKSAKTFSRALGLNKEINSIIEKYEYKHEEKKKKKTINRTESWKR